MLKCKNCGTLNADYAINCTKCNSKLQIKKLNDNGLSENDNDSNNIGMIIAVLSIIMGLIKIIVDFIDGSFSIENLFYVFLGVALITMIGMNIENSLMIKILKSDVVSLNKQLDEIKKEL